MYGPERCARWLWLALLVAAPGWADDAAVWNVQLENDTVAGNDRHFTHGTRISRLSPHIDIPPAIAERLLPRNATHRWLFAAGQNMFTPEDIALHEPIVVDRPYAGWLYASLGIASDSRSRPVAGEIGKSAFWELQIGTLGSRSRADVTQRWVHRVVDAQRPNGWEWQVRNKWGAILYGDYQYQIDPATHAVANVMQRNIEADVVPHLGVALGNVYSHLAGGVTVRIGSDLRSDYGPPRIRPGVSGPGAFREDRRNPGVHGYLFLGVETRAVGRNDFLLGSAPGPDRQVSKETLVHDTQYGLVVDPAPWIRLGITRVIRSREFKEQTEGSRFGALSLQFRTGF